MIDVVATCILPCFSLLGAPPSVSCLVSLHCCCFALYVRWCCGLSPVTRGNQNFSRKGEGYIYKEGVADWLCCGVHPIRLPFFFFIVVAVTLFFCSRFYGCCCCFLSKLTILFSYIASGGACRPAGLPALLSDSVL